MFTNKISCRCGIKLFTTIITRFPQRGSLCVRSRAKYTNFSLGTEDFELPSKVRKFLWIKMGTKRVKPKKGRNFLAEKLNDFSK